MLSLKNLLKKVIVTQKQANEIVGIPIERMKKMQEAARKVKKEIEDSRVQ